MSFGNKAYGTFDRDWTAASEETGLHESKKLMFRKKKDHIPRLGLITPADQKSNTFKAMIINGDNRFHSKLKYKRLPEIDCNPPADSL